MQWRATDAPLAPRLAAAAAIGLGPLLYFGYWQLRFATSGRRCRAQRNWEREDVLPATALSARGDA